MRFYFFFFVLGVLLLSLKNESSAIEVGDDAPDFTLIDTEGNQFKLSDQKGRIVVIFFMGYDCGSCLVEAPDVELNIHKQYLPYGVTVVGVDHWDGTPSIVNTHFILRTGITFPILTYGSAVGRLYNMTVSNYVIIGIDGKVKYLSLHYDPSEIQSNLDTLTNTAGERPKAIPYGFRLEQNYPNPFNPNTKIEYEIKVSEPVAVDLSVYNVLGKKIRTLVTGMKTSGFYEAIWDGTNDNGVKVPSGIYFYRLKARKISKIKSMVFTP